MSLKSLKMQLLW